jgi:hypothetical protein
MRPTALLPFQRKACCGFATPLKIYHLVRVRPVKLIFQILTHDHSIGAPILCMMFRSSEEAPPYLVSARIFLNIKVPDLSTNCMVVMLRRRTAVD